mgnify:CR=1 FL=1
MGGNLTIKYDIRGILYPRRVVLRHRSVNKIEGAMDFLERDHTAFCHSLKA